MADEFKRDSEHALEQLKELQKRDAISSLDITEPDLKGFDASSVFETSPEPEPKRRIFQKRAARTRVNVKPNVLENEEMPVEEIRVSNELKRTKKHAVMNKALAVEKPEESVIVEEVEEIPEPVQQKPVMELRKEEKPAEAVIPEPVEIKPEPEIQDKPEEIREEPVEIKQEPQEIKENESYVEDIEEEDEAIESSLEDENEYDEDELYVEKKRFLLSHYDKEEAYLEDRSKQGYHYVRNVGKKYYFVKEDPHHYYYSINYFADEPEAPRWRKWEAEGWKLVSRVPARRKQDAGWFVFRNELDPGDLKLEIPNEEDKYRFFRKYSGSCRSTMFLFFICMAVCAVAAYLQYLFNGFIVVIGACGFLFLISLILFFMYGRMLISSNKKVRLLKARLRVREREENFINEGHYDPTLTQEDLDTEWNTLNEEILEEEEEPKKKRSRRKRK